MEKWTTVLRIRLTLRCREQVDLLRMQAESRLNRSGGTSAGTLEVR